MNHEPLSEQGLARREQILQLARGEARRRRRRRFAGRGGVTLVILALACSLTLLRHRQPVVVPIPPIARVSPTPLPTVSQPWFAVQYVQTDPTITDRLTIQSGPPTWTSIDDHELLTELAAAGQPAGIVSVHGRTFLVPR